MEEYKAKRAALLRAVLEREEKERREEAAKLELAPIQNISLEDLEKMPSGEKSRIRRAIFKNCEITENRAKITADYVSKVETDLQEKFDKIEGIK